MNLRRLVLGVLSAAVLSACSRAGANGTPPQPPVTTVPPQPLAVATGTLTVTVPRTAAVQFRRPAYISSATTQAALFIDSITTAAGSSTSCSSGCTISYATTAGTHTFRAEIANGSNVVLAAASNSVTVVAGSGNNITLTLNGAADIASWVSTTSTTTNTITGTYSIEDPSAVLITSAPAGASTAFDNTPVSFSTQTSAGFSGTATFMTSRGSTTLAAPDASGNDYPFSATCSASANGTFTVHASAGSSGAGISAGQLSGLTPAVSYPSSTLNVAAMHSYGCINGTISDASLLALDGGAGSGTTCDSSPVSSCAVTLTTTKSNDVIVVYCVDGTAPATFSTPTATGLTFTQRGTTSSLANRTQALWYAIAASPISESVTCSWTSGAQVGAVIAFGVHGANTAAPFDTNAGLPYFNANFPNPNPSCTISTSNANDFIFTGVYSNGAAITANPASPFSSIVTNTIMAASYDVVSSVQTNLAIQWSASGSPRVAWMCDAIVAAGT